MENEIIPFHLVRNSAVKLLNEQKNVAGGGKKACSFVFFTSPNISSKKGTEKSVEMEGNTYQKYS